eukprot:TRINITY_DN4673_c0_g1_i1.p1 TRINITY_DN4673_c0_g1~~TRINITY_DN4673_c0_g1_i1.p1  ORF type:complete len:313 (+),score=121.39 TRINITY_DN4673_c0_g1_i1:22-960(+)
MSNVEEHEDGDNLIRVGESSTTDKYERVKRARGEEEKAPENEIRVMAERKVSTYIKYALDLLKTKNADTVIVKASGNAIPRACLMAEIIRRRVKGLHQIIEVKSTKVVDVYEPLEEGLDTVTVERNLTVFEIRITKNVDEAAKQHMGYHPPLPDEEIEEERQFVKRERQPGDGNRRRGQRRNFRPPIGGDQRRGDDGGEDRPYRRGGPRRDGEKRGFRPDLGPAAGARRRQVRYRNEGENPRGERRDDRPAGDDGQGRPRRGRGQRRGGDGEGRRGFRPFDNERREPRQNDRGNAIRAVSYTHLTLPTIYSV